MAGLPKLLTSRFRFWAAAIWNRGVALIAVAYVLAQIWDGASAQIVERWWDDPPLLIDAAIWAAQPPWYLWTIVGLVAFMILILEGTYHVAGQSWSDNIDLIDELRSGGLLSFFMDHSQELSQGLAVESGDRRRNGLGQLKMRGLVQMQRVAAVPEQLFGGVPMGGAPPYDLYTTTELGDRLARRLDAKPSVPRMAGPQPQHKP